MISAFGVDHGSISKGVPDWASGTIPASANHAYNRTKKHKVEAAARNVGWTAAGSAAGTAVGATLVGLAFRKGKQTKRIPKFFYRDTPVKNPFSGKKTKITSGEKQRYLGMTLGGTLGTVGGGAAGATHLKRLEKEKKYGYQNPKKEQP